MGMPPKQADAYNYEKYTPKKYRFEITPIRYRFFPSAFSEQTSPIGNFFYALPLSFLFSAPSVSAEHIKQFSV